VILVAAALGHPVIAAAQDKEQTRMNPTQALSRKQLSIAPIGAAMALGDMTQLTAALNEGLDAGLTITDATEILVQLYAYAGFPRSLNALGELMKVLEARKQRGVQDAPGHEPGPLPAGQELLAMGTANQTKLSGGPVKGALFEFAPAIDEYLKTHLFGDIFGRDNLDWQSRELATVGALAAMPGVESQLKAHIRISMNVGLTTRQLRDMADVLRQRGQADASRRAREALGQ
jgi:alkylhydroperoxidase/carboxymuconolactone decarboxylase family protein YurZ